MISIKCFKNTRIPFWSVLIHRYHQLQHINSWNNWGKIEIPRKRPNYKNGSRNFQQITAPEPYCLFTHITTKKYSSTGKFEVQQNSNRFKNNKGSTKVANKQYCLFPGMIILNILYNVLIFCIFFNTT